ncbi:MAG: aspartate aminotransferase family protein [Candidatus Eisenbacteria bacterium]|uniref:Aspartate aminotransferase family protein n=1 Tax=Eiseniibacteriota bacterium TaxID=2212470 RepID=A0A7Y2H3E6_UNCEI|nr:aspartate aminotransferase family protein [Candidatus Eisenbacteria bacterium]
MSHYPKRDELARVLESVYERTKVYLEELDERPVLSPDLQESLDHFEGQPLPEAGQGALEAVQELWDYGQGAIAHTSGPRCFHFVIGGSTPASLGADWFTSVMDQIAYAWISSPLSVRLEVISLNWLKELFGLDASMSGITTTGATMANFVGLASARQWWAEQHKVDVAQEGFANLPPTPVFSSGYVHAAAVKCLGMLGIGRQSVKRFAADSTGRVDLGALEQELRKLDGQPGLLLANAGEVNAGDFDPIEAMADLAEKYNLWLHVDGAFGLFAALSPRTAHLTKGIERAHSITVDGHKWLNVPYDSGFSFVRDGALMGKTFAYEADYLADPHEVRVNFGALGPESSRRARSFSTWATLRAYGRQGYRELIEHHLDLAVYLGKRVDEVAHLERLAEVQLNIVCLRFNPGNMSEQELNNLNERLGEKLLEDGRVLCGTTKYKGMTALRPAISNWRTEERDIDFFVDVVQELAGSLG